MRQGDHLASVAYTEGFLYSLCHRSTEVRHADNTAAFWGRVSLASEMIQGVCLLNESSALIWGSRMLQSHCNLSCFINSEEVREKRSSGFRKCHSEWSFLRKYLGKQELHEKRKQSRKKKKYGISPRELFPK